MTDRNVQFPNRYRIVPVGGTTDIVDLIPAPGNVEDEGTLLNKANLLSDETAVLLGNVDTPNEAFFKIRNALQNQSAPYGSDFYLFMAGNHPILSANPANDFLKVKLQLLLLQYKSEFERTITHNLSGNKETITTTVYDGGNF